MIWNYGKIAENGSTTISFMAIQTMGVALVLTTRQF